MPPTPARPTRYALMLYAEKGSARYDALPLRTSSGSSARQPVRVKRLSALPQGCDERSRLAGSACYRLQQRLVLSKSLSGSALRAQTYTPSDWDIDSPGRLAWHVTRRVCWLVCWL